MDKSTHFFGTSVFGQLISFIDDKIISKCVKSCNSDYYVKRFKTKDHLISMLFCVIAKCSSLREVSGAMLGLSGKTKHFRLGSLPYRSTLSDANTCALHLCPLGTKCEASAETVRFLRKFITRYFRSIIGLFRTADLET